MTWFFQTIRRKLEEREYRQWEGHLKRKLSKSLISPLHNSDGDLVDQNKQPAAGKKKATFLEITTNVAKNTTSPTEGESAKASPVDSKIPPSPLSKSCPELASSSLNDKPISPEALEERGIITTRLDRHASKRLRTLNARREAKITLLEELLKNCPSQMPEINRKGLLTHICKCEKHIRDHSAYNDYSFAQVARLERRIEACRDILALLPRDEIPDAELYKIVQKEVEVEAALELKQREERNRQAHRKESPKKTRQVPRPMTSPDLLPPSSPEGKRLSQRSADYVALHRNTSTGEVRRRPISAESIPRRTTSVAKRADQEKVTSPTEEPKAVEGNQPEVSSHSDKDTSSASKDKEPVASQPAKLERQDTQSVSDDISERANQAFIATDISLTTTQFSEDSADVQFESQPRHVDPV